VADRDVRGSSKDRNVMLLWAILIVTFILLIIKIALSRKTMFFFLLIALFVQLVWAIFIYFILNRSL